MVKIIRISIACHTVSQSEAVVVGDGEANCRLSMHNLFVSYPAEWQAGQASSIDL